MVKAVAGCSDGLSGTETYADVPFRLKALPTVPVAVVAPPTNAPLFTPALSTAFPSARYQAVAPLGRDTHDGAPAVSVSAVGVKLSVN